MTSALALMIVIGCGGPPQEEINKAKANKAAAETAKADVYATDQYDAGAKAWVAAEEAGFVKDWAKAKKDYAEAARLFDVAAKAAPAGHDQMKNDVSKAIADFDTKMGAGNKDMASKMKTMKKEDKAAMDKAGKECAALSAEAKDMLGKDDISGAKDKIDEANKHLDEMAAKMMPAKK